MRPVGKRRKAFSVLNRKSRIQNLSLKKNRQGRMPVSKNAVSPAQCLFGNKLGEEESVATSDCSWL